MADGKTKKWTWWSTLERLGRRNRPSAAGEDSADLENPWLQLHGAHKNRQDIRQDVSAPFSQVGSQSGSNSARWLSDSTSPYGFSDDDGTLKQIDGANWRNMFGNKRTANRAPSANAGSPNSRWQPAGSAARKSTTGVGGTWLLQSVAAAVLVVAGVYAQHTPGNVASQMQRLYQDAFATDYTDTAMPALQQFFANHNISVPVFNGSTGAIRLHVPVSGKVTEDYSSTHPEMYIQSSKGEAVLAAGSGTVRDVVKVNGTYMVMIDHGKLGKTTYTGLKDVSVKKGEAVTSGERIGHLPDTDKPVLQFALQQDGKYVNPNDFIHFPDSGV